MMRKMKTKGMRGGGKVMTKGMKNGGISKKEKEKMVEKL